MGRRWRRLGRQKTLPGSWTGFVITDDYARASPRRPFDIGGGQWTWLAGSVGFRHTVAGQRRPLTGFLCIALAGALAETLQMLSLFRNPSAVAQGEDTIPHGTRKTRGERPSTGYRAPLLARGIQRSRVPQQCRPTEIQRSAHTLKHRCHRATPSAMRHLGLPATKRPSSSNLISTRTSDPSLCMVTSPYLTRSLSEQSSLADPVEIGL